MPVTKSATKTLRKEKRRTKINKRIRKSYKESVKELRQNPNEENLKKAYSKLDRAAKKKIIHQKKADRLKSRLTKFFNQSSKAKKK